LFINRTSILPLWNDRAAAPVLPATTVTMDGETIVLPQTSSAAALRTAHAFWSRFVDRCIRERIDNDRFQSLVRLVHDEHPLPPAAVADLFLRPQADNCYSLDPRVPPYLQVLSDLEYIDAPAILRALYRYSSSHTLIESYQVPTHGNGDGNGKGNNEGNRNNDDKEQDTGNGIANVKDTDTASLNANHTHNGEETKSSVEKKGSEDKKSNESVPLRWKSSYWVEEVMFFRLCKSVHEGQAVRDTNTALEVIKIVSKWLALFTQASSAFAADLLAQVHNLQLEMESARAAFVPLLLRLTDNPSLLKVIARPVAKGTSCHL
jgi:mediator of RNA polymerase II transcription subunit 5